MSRDVNTNPDCSVDVHTAVWILHSTPVQSAALWFVTSFCPCVSGCSCDCQQRGEGKKAGKKETDRWVVGGGTDLEQTGGELLQLLAELVSDFRQSLTLLILQQQLLTHMHTHRKQQQNVKWTLQRKNDKKTINEEIKWVKCWRVYGRQLEPLVKKHHIQ